MLVQDTVQTSRTMVATIRRGMSGVDSIGLQHWLLKFGVRSHTLREAVADLTRWMVNDCPPWAATSALMANRLMALNKCPGVRPVGIGEI